MHTAYSLHIFCLFSEFVFKNWDTTKHRSYNADYGYSNDKIPLIKQQQNITRLSDYNCLFWFPIVAKKCKISNYLSKLVLFLRCTYSRYGSDFETSHTMTSPLVHPVASREPHDVINMSVHVTSRVFSSDSDWLPAGDVIRKPRSSCVVIVVMTSRNSRNTGRSRDLLMSYIGTTDKHADWKLNWTSRFLEGQIQSLRANRKSGSVSRKMFSIFWYKILY